MVNYTKSTRAVSAGEIKREWHLFDAKNQVVGRFVSKIVTYLIGKNKSNFVPYLDMGDYVIVVNAKDVILTGKKAGSKVYTRYSGYPGGLKTKTFEYLKTEKPEDIIRHAVSGMLPKNKLRDKRMTRLFVYRDEKHPK